MLADATWLAILRYPAYKASSAGRCRLGPVSLAEKISDLRWHVATTGHRHFAITNDYVLSEDVEGAMQQRYRLQLEPGTGNSVWVIACVSLPASCRFECRISETEIAEAGRYDLTEKFGIGALVESIKLETRREAPKAWSKVGELDIGEDDPV